jgi:septal ring factor EnvC (AmiA/AmiB activator)
MQYQPPHGDRPPTEPTRRVVESPSQPVTATSEVVYESDLVERIDRARFWANFGAVAATLAAIIGVIALIVALQAKDDAHSSDGSNAGLRRDVRSLQSDVAQLKGKASSAGDATKQLDQISNRLDSLDGKLTKLQSTQTKTDAGVTKLQTDLSDLTDRVDQVEQAQENGAAGGP